jgi:hypothetical protein
MDFTNEYYKILKGNIPINKGSDEYNKYLKIFENFKKNIIQLLLYIYDNDKKNFQVVKDLYGDFLNNFTTDFNKLDIGEMEKLIEFSTNIKGPLFYKLGIKIPELKLEHKYYFEIYCLNNLYTLLELNKKIWFHIASILSLKEKDNSNNYDRKKHIEFLQRLSSLFINKLNYFFSDKIDEFSIFEYLSNNEKKDQFCKEIYDKNTKLSNDKINCENYILRLYGYQNIRGKIIELFKQFKEFKSLLLFDKLYNKLFLIYNNNKNIQIIKGDKIISGNQILNNALNTVKKGPDANIALGKSGKYLLRKMLTSDNKTIKNLKKNKKIIYLTKKLTK